MYIPELGKTKDLQILQTYVIMFQERLGYFRKDVVEPSPSIKTSGIEGKMQQLFTVMPKISKILEEMKEMVEK